MFDAFAATIEDATIIGLRIICRSCTIAGEKDKFVQVDLKIVGLVMELTTSLIY